MRGDKLKDNYEKVKMQTRNMITVSQYINVDKYPQKQGAREADLFRKGDFKELVKEKKRKHGE